MSRLPDGFAFFRGLLTGVAGLALLLGWYAVGNIVMLGRKTIPGYLWALLLFAVGLLILGPAWYWVIRPVYYWRWGE